MADLLPPIPQKVWDRVELRLTKALANLGDRVQELCPQAQSKQGSIRNKGTSLFVYRSFNYNQGETIVVGVRFIQVGFIEMLLDEGNGERTRAIFLGDVSVRANIYREETGQIYLEKEDIHIPPRTKDLLAVTHILLVPTLKKWAAPVSTILLTLAGKPPKDILTTWIRAAKP